MSEEIDLEQILNNQINIGFDFRKFYGTSTTNTIVKAMKEACRKTLELAAENAKLKYNGELMDGSSDYIVNKQSILNTINQIK